MRGNFPYTDEDKEALRSNVLWAKIKKNGFIGGLFTWFIQGVVRGASFSVQSILRYRIGVRSYGVFTILFAFIWTNFFSVLSFPIESLDDILPYFIDLDGHIKIDDHIKGANSQSGLTYVLSFIVLAAGCFHLLYEHFAEDGNKPDMGSRGHSLLLGWASNLNLSIDKKAFTRIIEPLLIIVIGVLLLSIEKNFSWFLILGGAALFYEELKAYNAKALYDDPTRKSNI